LVFVCLGFFFCVFQCCPCLWIAHSWLALQFSILFEIRLENSASDQKGLKVLYTLVIITNKCITKYSVLTDIGWRHVQLLHILLWTFESS
jgi:hypothetical protein